MGYANSVWSLSTPHNQAFVKIALLSSFINRLNANAAQFRSITPALAPNAKRNPLFLGAALHHLIINIPSTEPLSN
jgi:hypothetical protein